MTQPPGRRWTARLYDPSITPAQFVFQLVIVTIGVYIGVAIQARVEQRDRSEAARRLVHAIDQELERDQRSLEDIVAHQVTFRTRLGELGELVRTETRPDTAIRRIVNGSDLTNRTFFSRRAAYSTLLAGGQLQYVMDTDLRLYLAELYEHNYVRLARNGEIYDDIFQTVFRRALLDYWDYKLQRPINSSADAAVQLSNAAHRMVQFSIYYDGLLQAEIQNLKAVRAGISRYLPR